MINIFPWIFFITKFLSIILFQTTFLIVLQHNIKSELEIKISEKEYIRFSKKRKKKGSNNVLAVYLTVHFVILFLAILVG